MPDVEDRLRTAFEALADEVAPSEDPRAELARRLDARRRARRRVPALAAAAAAIVVGAVFVPVVANQPEPDTFHGSTVAPPPRMSTLGTLVRDGRPAEAVGYLQGDRYCTAVRPRGDTDQLWSICEPVPTWPEGPADSLVQSRELLNGDAADDTGMLAQRLVFLTDPRVTTLAVRRGDGTGVSVREFGRNEHAAVFLADFAGPVVGFGYTATDARGTVLENAIS